MFEKAQEYGSPKHDEAWSKLLQLLIIYGRIILLISFLSNFVCFV